MPYNYHSGVFPELNELTFEQLVERFVGDPPEPDEINCYYDDVTYVMRKHGEIAVNYLIQQWDRVNLVQRKRAILNGLTYRPPIDRPEVLYLLHESLNDSDPLVAMDAIDGLWLLEKRDDLDRVLTLRQHPNPWVQGSVLRYMSRLFPDKAFPMLIEATQHAHYIVRWNAADELDKMDLSEEQWSEAEPHLRRLLKDEHEAVRDSAKWALAREDWENQC